MVLKNVIVIEFGVEVRDIMWFMNGDSFVIEMEDGI